MDAYVCHFIVRLVLKIKKGGQQFNIVILYNYSTIVIVVTLTSFGTEFSLNEKYFKSLTPMSKLSF